ncbi:MAG TPA: YIP1 family protein [Steroidobacteraceae bacterium]|nr:YIP1 family protein [Steroidobacteraceae bacterium]
MSILHVHKLFLSSQQGWDELARTPPSALRLFLLLVLPFSLVPPLMLEYAGHHLGAALFPGAPAQAWSTTALVFLLAELATVPLMAWAIRSVAHSKRIASDYRDAFTLAAIAAVPLWLSSLVLLSGEIVVILAVLALGVAGSVALIFRGVESVLKVEDSLVAFDVAYTVTALGLVAWVVLVMLGLVPALA